MRKKRKNKPRGYTFFVADFETTYHKEFSNYEILSENKEGDNARISFQPDEKSIVFLVGIMKMVDEKYFLTYEHLPDFFNTVAQETYNDKNSKCVIFFHNLKYDGSYILNWLLKNNYTQTLKKNEYHHPIINFKEFSLFASKGKFFELIFKWRGITLFFRDSLKLLPQSLEALGKLVEVKKLKDTIDYREFKLDTTHNYPQIWLDYLFNDVLILNRVLQQTFKKNITFQKKLTIGSVAYTNIATSIKKSLIGFKFTKKEYDYYDLFYYGGLCFPSKNLIGTWTLSKGNIRMIDAVSMYPSQMVKALPFGPPVEKGDCCFQEIKIYSFKLKEKYNDFAVMRSSLKIGDFKRMKIIDYQDSITSEYLSNFESEMGKIWYFVKDEFELIKKLYDIKYEIVKETFFETKPFLKDTIDTLFLDKKIAAENNLDVEKTIAKLILNNLYGKIAQHYQIPFDFYGNLKDVTDEYEMPTRQKSENNRNNKNEAYVLRKKVTDDMETRPVHIAAYITALARCSLIEKYMELKKKKGTFLYCDTDSIAFIDNKIKFKNVGNELGDWNFESFLNIKENKKYDSCDAFLSLFPKQYRATFYNQQHPAKMACAGVKKSLMFEVKNKDYNYAISENKEYNLIRTPLKMSEFGVIIDSQKYDMKKYKKLKVKNYNEKLLGEK